MLALARQGRFEKHPVTPALSLWALVAQPPGVPGAPPAA